MNPHLEGTVLEEEGGTPGSRAVERLQVTPIGILLIAAVLLIVAAGLLVGGVYLLLDRERITLWAVALVLVASPAILYLDYHLIRFTHWAWMTLVALLVLMAVSSVGRLLLSPGLPIAPGGEILLEILAAWYLSRPGIRSRFSRSAE